MKEDKQPIRVLLAKIGLDGHDRGIKVVARILRDAGMEVIYTGLHRSVADVVDAAIQEDVDVIGVSMLSGAHMTAIPKLMDALRAQGVHDIAVVAGGVIPDADAGALRTLGVADIFLQDTPPKVIVDRITRSAAQRPTQHRAATVAQNTREAL